MHAGALANPAIAAAMNQPEIKTMLGSAGLTHATDPDGYNQYTGAMSEWIREYQQQHQRAPTQKDVATAGQTLLVNHYTQGMSIFGFHPLGAHNAGPVYNSPIPDDLMNKAKAQHPELSDVQIQQKYAAHLVNKFYGKPSADESEE
jgi:hypothetical protein